jgi:AraC family transcriptional regulator of adaptative response / DNA-3-methyladenine glycosylase II
MTDDDLRYRAVQSRDPRFDGWFFVAVTSTGIYCRPSCASVLPGRARVRFYPTAAAAQRAGFRACKRCRPDASPGSPEWNRRSDVVGRAMREIADGVVDREGVAGLAFRLGYSARQLNRLLIAEVGAGPLELARAQRAQAARILLETTNLRIAEVAFAAGFGSVRQFNDTIRAVFAEAPSALRARGGRGAGRGATTGASISGSPGSPASAGAPATPGSVTLRLAYRSPFPSALAFKFLADRAVPGVEVGDLTSYSRALSLPHGGGLVEVRAGDEGERWLRATMRLDDLRDLTTAVKRIRQLFDLDADPEAVAGVLGQDPMLRPALAVVPGLRIPGHVDGHELAIRAVLGQQVSVAGARTVAGRLAAEYGEPVRVGAGAGIGSGAESGAIERRFPTVAVIAALSPADLPMPTSRAQALIGLCVALADGSVSLHPGADRDAVSAKLLALPGIGPWTVAYVRMRALGDPDAFMPSDLGVRRALERAGLPGDERSATTFAEQWRPYRAYALQYLWAGALTASGDTTKNYEKEAVA